MHWETHKFRLFSLSWYSLHCGGLESSPHYLWGEPGFQMDLPPKWTYESWSFFKVLSHTLSPMILLPWLCPAQSRECRLSGNSWCSTLPTPPPSSKFTFSQKQTQTRIWVWMVDLGGGSTPGSSNREARKWDREGKEVLQERVTALAGWLS